MRRSAERASPPGRTPVWLTSFVGRRRELAALTDAVRRHRLITLVGPGGVGKSRLAGALAQHYGTRSWWSDVAGLPDTIRDIKRAGTRVVVLDAGAGIRTGAFVEVAEHLVIETDATVVVTSRRPLAVAGEQRWPVHGLSATEAATLFLARLREAEPGATVDRDALAELCTALDGIPLALEIAAGQARTAGVRELVADLRRLVRVIGGPRSPHHRAPQNRAADLATGIRDSRSTLSPEADLALQHVHLLAGPFPVPLVEALVCPPLSPAAVREALVELVDAGLVRSEIGPTGPLFTTPRLTALVVGHERTGRTAPGTSTGDPDTRRRRAVTAMLHVAASHLHGPDALRWLHLARDRAADADMALEHAAQTGAAALTGLVEPLAELWFRTGDHARATRWTRAEATGPFPNQLTDAARGRAARAAVLAGEPGTATALMGGGPGPAPPPPSSPTPPSTAATLHPVRAATAHLLTSGRGIDDLLTALDRLHDAAGPALVESLTLAAEALALLGHAAPAHDLLTRTRALVDRVDDVAARGRVLAGLAVVVLALDGPGAAAGLAQRAAAAARQSGDAHALVHAELVAARCAAAAGHWLDGHRRVRRTWMRLGPTGAGLASIPMHGVLVELASGAGRTVDLRTEGPDTATRGPFLTAAWSIVVARHHLAAGRLDQARDLALPAGATLAGMDTAGWTARARWVLGEAALAGGDLPAARREFQAAVRTGAVSLDPALPADCVDGLVRIAWVAGDRPRARRLLAAVDQWRSSAGWSRSPPAQRLVAAVGPGATVRRRPDGDTPGPDGGRPRTPRPTAVADLVALALQPGTADPDPADDDVARRLAVLSPTEREVSRLVAAGRSNLEVGRELFMSLSTVKTHLSHIYRKLAVTGRAQLAYLLAQHVGDHRP